MLLFFSFVRAHLQEFPHLTFFYLCSKTEQHGAALALSDTGHSIRALLPENWNAEITSNVQVSQIIV